MTRRRVTYGRAGAGLTPLVFGSASSYRMPANVGVSNIAAEQKKYGRTGGWTGRGGPFPMLPPEGTPSNPRP